jgi:ABC-2 type transport system permease protein
VEGRFESYFKGKPSPLLEGKKDEKNGAKQEDSEDKNKDPGKEENKPPVITSVIEKSPESSRVFVIGSNEFLSDQVLQISAMGGTTRYLNSLQLVENAVDWSLEDQSLLAIRSRGHFSRTLAPMDKSAKTVWELISYGLAIGGLIGIFLLYWLRRRSLAEHYNRLLSA